MFKELVITLVKVIMARVAPEYVVILESKIKGDANSFVIDQPTGPQVNIRGLVYKPIDANIPEGVHTFYDSTGNPGRINIYTRKRPDYPIAPHCETYVNGKLQED